jgi:hypothetical protein
MAETTSVLTVLAACTALVLGMLRFLTWFARSSNADYRALAKQLETERADKLKITAERDEWKLNALKYADQREEALRYASHWRDKYKTVIQAPPLIPIPPEEPADSSQITKFDLGLMRVEIESDSASFPPPNGTASARLSDTYGTST